MKAGVVSIWFASMRLARCLGLASSLAFSGCVYRGGQSHTLDEAGTPQGITAISVPFQKIIAQAPEPAGFSSTYQKMRLDQQKLARRFAEREAQARAAEWKSKTQSIPASAPASPTPGAAAPAPAARAAS